MFSSLTFTEDPNYASPEDRLETYPTAKEAASIIATNTPQYNLLSSLFMLNNAFGVTTEEIDNNFRAICDALEKNTHIKHINFYCRALQGNHSIMLSNVLLNNSTIKSITICGCDDLGAAAFAEALKVNKSLSRLDFVLPSPVLQIGCQTLIDSLTIDNHTLTEVRLSSNPDNRGKLEKLLERNQLEKLQKTTEQLARVLRPLRLSSDAKQEILIFLISNNVAESKLVLSDDKKREIARFAIQYAEGLYQKILSERSRKKALQEANAQLLGAAFEGNLDNDVVQAIKSASPARKLSL